MDAPRGEGVVSPAFRHGAPPTGRHVIPGPARMDDGNDWTWAACWGWCERSWVRVLWVGTATTEGHRIADLYYCGSCIRHMHRRVEGRPS
ncbi:hypothetical protein GCM10009654_18160 [Streptomyces hebeiensis]|uniref:Uncharacterized protein n=1 Tax=Streptomyces hebeiensis TaxID=229486 RepID=A0ABN1UQE6_9ACTN